MKYNAQAKQLVFEIVQEIMNKGYYAHVCEKFTDDGWVDYGFRYIADPSTFLKPTIWFEFLPKKDDEFLEPEYYAQYFIDLFREKVPADIIKIDSLVSMKGYDEIKEFIRPWLIRRECYSELLKDVPHRPFLDFAVTYCIALDSCRAIITNEQRSKLGVDEEILYNDSVSGLKPITPVLLAEASGETDPQESKDEPPIYALSVEDSLGGSSVLLLDDYLSDLADRIGDFYITITNCHLATAMPVDKIQKFMSLENIMASNREIFQSQTSVEDILTDKVYVYKKDTGKIEELKA
ncbi:MAG: DUF5688 family protein [Lachnospiraceae bacterium]|nr:DUF5688 family protein [Lachnospiraceae bacterium]